MAIEIGKATSSQVREVLKLLVSGTTSDVTSMEQIAGSWWRRFLFMRWFGPRFLGKQMDTFVATEGDRILGFVIVQYDGDAAGTFDWAYVEPLHVDEKPVRTSPISSTLPSITLRTRASIPTSTLVSPPPHRPRSPRYLAISVLVRLTIRTRSWLESCRWQNHLGYRKAFASPRRSPPGLGLACPNCCPRSTRRHRQKRPK